jgi:hypothetical protein
MRDFIAEARKGGKTNPDCIFCASAPLRFRDWVVLKNPTACPAMSGAFN